MPNIDHIQINLSEQKLYLLDANQQTIHEYPISSSAYGSGNQSGSFQTPLGEHVISEKIGEQASEMEVFIGRQPQGVLSDLMDKAVELPEDIITSRIMWLEGCEPGLNQGGDVDTHQRYIYIHGTNEENTIGSPVSHGCIRMKNTDVIELFGLVDTGCPVIIEK
ncbi:MAG: L,D-transpeptidase family protein [Gammaproteobacteria bacterium]